MSREPSSHNQSWRQDPTNSAADSGCSLEKLRDVGPYPLFERGSFAVDLFELLVELLEPRTKVDAVVLDGCHTHVAAGIQAPALLFNLIECRHTAQSWHVDVVSIRERLV